ncbi:MAG: hypothetical protein R3Y05_01920 [bacterium]
MKICNKCSSKDLMEIFYKKYICNECNNIIENFTIESEDERKKDLKDAALFFLASGRCSINALQYISGYSFNKSQSIVHDLSNLNIIKNAQHELSLKVILTKEEIIDFFK